MDPWYPLGRGSMLQAANLLLHTAHPRGFTRIPQLYDMITANSARSLGVEADCGIEVGKPADLIVLNAASEFDALRLRPECLWVIRRDRVIACTTPARCQVQLGGRSEEGTF